MIKIRTTLVLGAGASMPYGFPSGSGLLNAVVRRLGSPESDLMRILLALGHHQEEISEFRAALTFGKLASIDMLVTRRNPFVDMAKVAIACELIPCEQTTSLFSIEEEETKDHWYHLLLDRLDDGTLEDFPRNQLSVVTFNYDRSLEHFLFKALRYRWNLGDIQTIDLLNTISIVHVYGQLETLPEPSRLLGRPFGGQLDVEGAKEGARQIRLVHEGGNSPMLQQAQQRLHDADQIVFLGFGYDPTNLERLKVKELVGRTIKGTALGLFPDRRPEVTASFRPATIDLGGVNEDVRAFLKGSHILA